MLSPRAKRHICRTALVALCSLASVIVSFAQGENTIIGKCGKLHTQAEMNDCAATEAKKADAALNTTYRELLNRVRETRLPPKDWSPPKRLGSSFAMPSLRQSGPSRKAKTPAFYMVPCIPSVSPSNSPR